MYDHTLQRGRKHFFRYCLQAFSREEILIYHIKDRFQINDEKGIIMTKKGEYLRFNSDERKINSSFMQILKVY